ncbi:MAG: alpha/beta hydrolase [Oceanospirillaceae bacterium]|nr:alpha/beta hydrolase [Oceanospirillaceae bacterium]
MDALDAIVPEQQLRAVGTQRDHVAPWRSLYKINLLTDTDVTFLLTSGGHNAGIVSEPGHPHRTYQVATLNSMDKFVSPEEWCARTPSREGSWWPEWNAWLTQHSDGKSKPPATGAPRKGYPHPARCAGGLCIDAIAGEGKGQVRSVTDRQASSLAKDSWRRLRPPRQPLTPSRSLFRDCARPIR